MFRLTFFVVAAACACGGARPTGTPEIDHRADLLIQRGSWDEARAVLDPAIADAHARGDRASEARLRLRRGHAIGDAVRHRGGDRAAAQVDLDAARALADATGDRALVADCVDALAMLRFTRWFASQDPADLAAADAQFRAALALRPPGDTGARSESEFHLGLVHQMRGELAPAGAHFAAALAIAERVHDDARMSYATRHLGFLAELRHDWDTAEAMYRRSLTLRETFGPGPGVAAAIVALAELRYARGGAPAEAIAELTRARTIAATAGSAAYVAIAGEAIARVQRDTHQLDAALATLDAALAANAAIHSDENVPEMYEQRALIELLAERPAAAVADVDLAIARRSSPRLVALRALALARDHQHLDAPAAPSDDPVVRARLALAAGQLVPALDAALAGDDPDTLLLAALAGGGDARDRAALAAQALTPAQGARFARELHQP